MHRSLIFIISKLSNVHIIDVIVKDELLKLRALSAVRLEEVKVSVEKTFCHRQSWITKEKPSTTDILMSYPKFGLLPKLI